MRFYDLRKGDIYRFGKGKILYKVLYKTVWPGVNRTITTSQNTKSGRLKNVTNFQKTYSKEIVLVERGE